MILSNNAMILNEKLPLSQKDKNSYLNNLRKDPNIKEFFEGEKPNIKDLPELNQYLKKAREEKIKELSEAKQNAKDESSMNSLRDSSGLSSSENYSKDLKGKEDLSNYSDYKLDYNFLPKLLEFLSSFF